MLGIPFIQRLEHLCTTGVPIPGARIPLGVRTEFIPIEDEVYVLRKALYVTIHLGETGSTFEYNGVFQGRLELAPQHPAHPEILFDGSGRHVHFSGGLSNQLQALRQGKLDKFIHNVVWAGVGGECGEVFLRAAGVLYEADCREPGSATRKGRHCTHHSMHVPPAL